MSRSWVSHLLRARQAQEDIANERVAQARRNADEARQIVAGHDDRITAMVAHSAPESTVAFVAAASARQAAAATWATARRVHGVAEDQVTVSSAAAIAAARQRRSVEKLAERDEAADRARAATAEQNELDDIGSRRARSKADV